MIGGEVASVSIVAMESPGRSAAGGGGGTSAMVGEEVASGGEVASVSIVAMANSDMPCGLSWKKI